jgi:hypothetical protein
MFFYLLLQLMLNQFKKILLRLKNKLKINLAFVL